MIERRPVPLSEASLATIEHDFIHRMLYGTAAPKPLPPSAELVKEHRRRQRDIARAFWVPEHMVVTFKVPWWRRRWQSWRRRP